MRLLFIRHGEPDYETDTLTAKGRDEADALAAIIRDLHPGHIYMSPLGRASETAERSLRALYGEAAQAAPGTPAAGAPQAAPGTSAAGAPQAAPGTSAAGAPQSAPGTSAADAPQPAASTRLPDEEVPIVLPWLREFPARIDTSADPELQWAYPQARRADGSFGDTIVWDIMPSYVAAHPELLDSRKWRHSDIAAKSDLLAVYDHVRSEFDALLGSYGYIRQEHGTYQVVGENQETLTFFCHFGITAVLLSILWDISPFIPLQVLCALTTSVTEVVTEEREPGVAMFRALRFGDISHLMMAGQEPSFAARYREVYSDKWHRK